MRRVFIVVLLFMTLCACAPQQTSGSASGGGSGSGGVVPVPTALSGTEFCKRFDLASVNHISNTNFVAFRAEAASNADGSRAFDCTFVGAGVDVNSPDAALSANHLSINVGYEVSRAAADQFYGSMVNTILAQPTTPPCATNPNGGWRRALTISGLSAIEVFSCRSSFNRPVDSPFGLLIRKDTIWFDISYTGPGDLEAAGRYVVSRVP